LPSTPHFTESVSGGFDFKRSDNSLAFGILTLGPDTVTDVDQFVLSYQFSGSDDWGTTAGSATIFMSPGGMTNYDNTQAYQTQRAGAQANYAYEQYALTRITKLPVDFAWTMRGLLQVSNENLLPSEELGLGGYQTVRGYQEREVNGDHGFLFSNEVSTPPVSLAALFGSNRIKDQLIFLGFVDYGGTGLYQQTASDINPSSNLLGVGPGLRYVISPYLSVRFDYGFQLINTNLGDGQHSRGDVGVLVSF
jgi:hemolysin activation/secretion protein